MTEKIWAASDFIIEHTNDLGKIIANNCAGMIIGPCIGYVIQCYKMNNEKNSEGFSPYVCLILLIANILRVLWW